MAHPEYSSRHAARCAARDRLQARENLLANGRLSSFAVAAAMGWLALVNHWFSPAWTALPLAVFVVLVYSHHLTTEARIRAERAVAFYAIGLARLADRWPGQGSAGDRFLDPAHPYAADLDLFGKGSLFQRLCTARTHAGEGVLARWLLAPAAADEVRRRQEAVAELAPRLDLREELAVRGESLREGFCPERLRRWGGPPADPSIARLRVVAALLAAAVVTTGALWATGVADTSPLLLALAAQGAFALALRGRVRRVTGTVRETCRDLHLLGDLLAVLEGESFRAPKLVDLSRALKTDGTAPSRRLAQLRRLIDLLDAPRNQAFSLVAPLMAWTTQVALALESWRGRYAGRLAGWAELLGELEALAALAAYAHERPDDPFPEVVEPGARFEAVAVGHPLLPRKRCVRNDVRLDPASPLLLVSGSNMSGKSTLLRTVGTNVVLALAGAPVCAEALRLSPLRIGASIITLDSIQEGTSRFYAEIKRIRSIVELTRGPAPVLFLLDEVLQGTNSRDRRIGAEAILRGLVAAGAIGLVTTHDLALTEIAAGRNVHFQDEMVGGAMHFDYRLRPGVVAGSNALALMRAVGLAV